MSRRALLFVTTLIPAMLLPAARATAATVDVAISGFAFSPSSVQINVGDTVRWTNSDSAAHTVTSDTSAFGSGTLSQNQTFSFTFTSAGTFPYHCGFHPGMTGSVSVQSAPPPPTHTVSGTVTGPAAPGTLISVVGSVTRTATTAADGTYTVVNVPTGSFSVQPSKAGFTFTPASTPLNISASVTGIDFSSTAVPPPPPLFSISGKVTGPAASGTSVSVTGPATRLLTTAPNGTYLASNLPAGTYLVLPTRTGFSFTPASLEIDLSASVANQDFISAPAAAVGASLTVALLKLRVSTKLPDRDSLSLRATFVPDPATPFPDPAMGDALTIEVDDFFTRTLLATDLVPGKKPGQFTFRDETTKLKLTMLTSAPGGVITIKFSVKRTDLQASGPVDPAAPHAVRVVFGAHEASAGSGS